MNLCHYFCVTFIVFQVFLLSPCCGEKAENSEQEVHKVGRVINYLTTNKTVKILNGQQRPSSPVQHLQVPAPPPQQYQQIQNTNPIMGLQNNNYQNQNQYQYPPQFPQSPDLSGQQSGQQPSFQQRPQPPQQSTSGVPEVYMQIIGAIEKLVGRMDKLDSRLQTLENIVLHISNKKEEKPQLQQGNCPDKFVKIEGIRGKCFHISTFLNKNTGAIINSGFELFDWKTAHAECNKLGGRLSEMIQYDDFLRISQFLVKYSDLKSSAQSQTSTDFWIGGINPGLIWIWSDTGHKVGMDGRFWNENDNSSNAPGCLKLSYSHRLDSFFFKGSPCSHTNHILCEIMDNSVSRALAEFEQELVDDDTLMKEEVN